MVVDKLEEQHRDAGDVGDHDGEAGSVLGQIGRLWRRLHGLVQNNAWGLLDHGLVSAANFLTMVVAARALGESVFGEFTLVYSLLFLVSRVQNALICQPQYVLGASLRGRTYLRYTSTNALSQVLLALGTCLLVLVAALSSWLVGWHVYPFLLAFAPVVLFWQLQDFGRAAMYCEERWRSAFANDLLSYGVQPAVLIVLWRAGELNGPRVLLVIAMTSAVAALVGCWQIRRSLASWIDIDVIRENWYFGKWLAGANLGNWLSTEAFLYLSAVILDSAAAGILKAASVLFGPIRILVFFTSSVLPVRLSRAYARQGEDALRERVRLSVLIVAPIFAAYCLLVTLLAGPLIRLLYGNNYSNVTRVVGIFALGTFAIELAGLISNGLEVQRQTPAIFVGGVGSSIVAVVGGWLLIELFGVDGAALSMVLAGVMTTGVFWYAYRRGDDSPLSADRSEAMDIDPQRFHLETGDHGTLEPMQLPPLPERPLVSIIMPNYNYAGFIGLAIESALSQTYDNLELLVVDDCSTDNSVEVITERARWDSRVILIRHEMNQGHQSVLGTGFAAARGEIICLLDSDDIFMPDKVESIVRRFQELPNAGFLVHRAMVVDSDGRPVQLVPLIGKLQEGWLASYLLDHGGGWRDMATSALSFRREVGQLALPIPQTGLRASGDCYCFTIMPMLTEVAAIDRPLNLWRIHGGNGYGTFELTLPLVEGDLRYTEGNWKAVNQRLVELGFPERQLDRHRHLHYHRRTFERQLILGEPRLNLAIAYLRLVPRIAQSDLAGTLGKGIRLLGYGLAIPLPMVARRRWLNLIFGKSRTRQRAATIVRFLTRSRPSPTAAGGPLQGQSSPSLVNSPGQSR